MRRLALLFCAILFVAITSHGQVVENVLVETYHVQPSATAGEPPLTTYRIFIDLPPGHLLQMVYGDEKHQLFLFTSTSFHNDKESGVKYADQLDTARLMVPSSYLDSWLTMGAASNGHMAIPLAIDRDGSIFDCPPYDGASTRPDPLCRVDGLIAVPKVKEIVNLNMDPGFLGTSKGQLIETTNGAWAVLGGIKGATVENMVLIAQITTTGELSFNLNLQVGTPDKQVVKIVARNSGPGELQFEGLSYGRDYHEFFH